MRSLATKLIPRNINKSYFIQIAATLLFACQSSPTSTTIVDKPEAEKTDCRNNEVGQFSEITIDAVVKTSIEGIDIASLIADPTSEEIQLAWEDITQRSRSVNGLIEEDTFSVSMGGHRAMAERDQRIKWVLNFVGPLDFIGRTLFQRTFDLKLLENGLKSNYDVPTNFGEQHVYFFLEELKKGEVSTETVRRKIIQSSPYYFAPKLANTRIQMHYGVKDISFVQLQRFHAQMEGLGLSCPEYEVYSYPKRAHDLVGDKPVNLRVDKFVDKILEN